MSTILQGRHRRRVLVAVAAGTAALTAIAACSSSKSSSTATTAAASGTTAAPTPTTASGPKTVTVTLIGPFAGPFASSSAGIQKSLQYVFDQANAGSGPETAPGVTFKLTTVDDQSNSSTDLDAARTAQSNGNHILVLVSGGAIAATQPLTSAGQLVGFEQSPPDVNNDVSKYPYNFDFYPLDSQGIGAQIKLATSKSLTKFAVIAGAGDQYQGYVDDVNKDLPQDPGAKVVLSQRFDPSTTDYSSIATKIQQSGADSIWFFGSGSNVQQFYQALQAANISLPIFNAFGGLTCNCVAFPKTFLSHVYNAFPGAAALGPDGTPLHSEYWQLTQALWAKYNLTNIADKFVGPSALSAEMGYAIVWAVKQAGGDDPAKIKAAMEATEAAGGQSFVSPAIKYAWSPTNHAGFPVSQVIVINDALNFSYPGFFPAAAS